MFWRLFPTLVLSLLVLMGLIALLIVYHVTNSGVRGDLLGGVAGLTLGGCIVALILSLWLSRRISRPLEELMHAAEHVGVGNKRPQVLINLTGEVASLGHTFNDMSDRLATRIARLEEDRQQLRTILSGMVEGVVALDAEQRILFVNDRANQLLELHMQAPVGRRLWEVVRHRQLLDMVQRALERQEPLQEELSWTGMTTRSLTLHAARLPGEPSRGAVLVLHDTSELRRLERMREEFVANVSHELKTPLSVIQACVETLQLGAVDDVQHRGIFLDRIAAQSIRLHALILDLISLARIESGEELFELGPVTITSVVQACLERHRTRAEGRKQTLRITNANEGAEDTQEVWADEEAFRQILDNLIDNAVKYTPEGGEIRVSWRTESENVCLEVADNGIGIPEHDLPRIFERFYRVDKARSREMGGTGLGLSIVKHLAQALHGSVRATSRIGEGSTFSVRLPRAQPE
jgi:two-component system, OmpR family, phosphate regulon sensor histidine kinase PhoR